MGKVCVHDGAWIPFSQVMCVCSAGFLSVEGSEVNEVVSRLRLPHCAPVTDCRAKDLTGKILATYRLPRLLLHDVAVTPDMQRMLGVATLLESPNGLQPHKARKEKRIIGMPD